ncbi:DUF1146 family protein [Limosilactobacillus mucosae]|uniref:DUF1146 family protein n=1 Tax=Limosilactobacillus mucosae TaxID=97478 RepID=UPI003994921B
MELTGLQALITIVIQLGFIWIAFYALQGLHMERCFRRPPKTLPLLTVLLATALGYLNASFLLTVLKAIRNLIYLAQ